VHDELIGIEVRVAVMTCEEFAVRERRKTDEVTNQEADGISRIDLQVQARMAPITSSQHCAR
jgi:hypothetical protein